MRSILISDRENAMTSVSFEGDSPDRTGHRGQNLRKVHTDPGRSGDYACIRIRVEHRVQVTGESDFSREIERDQIGVQKRSS